MSFVSPILQRLYLSYNRLVIVLYICMELFYMSTSLRLLIVLGICSLYMSCGKQIIVQTSWPKVTHQVQTRWKDWMEPPVQLDALLLCDILMDPPYSLAFFVF